ncbi:MAG: hypothetical protein KOO69_03395 [Victivallales bacterium]|nr:hypothetical protein [Victivallales bacterium]
MKINRVIFVGLWILFTALLYILPGFEIRGLAIGLIIGSIIGYIPFIILEQLGITQHSHPFVILIAVFIFSGTYVVLLSWLIDKLKVFNRPHVIILAVCVLLSCITISSLGYSYEGWRGSSIVQQAVESPEVKYQATRWEYRKNIAIPKALAGCQVGLYIALLACAISSIVIYQKRKRQGLDR